MQAEESGRFFEEGCKTHALIDGVKLQIRTLPASAVARSEPSRNDRISLSHVLLFLRRTGSFHRAVLLLLRRIAPSQCSGDHRL